MTPARRRTFSTGGAIDLDNPVLPGSRHQQAHVRVVPPARQRVDDHAGERAATVQRDARHRFRLQEQRRIELRRRDRRHRRGEARRLQPAADARPDSRRPRRPGQRRVRRRERSRSLSVQRRHQRRLGVSAAAAVGEPAVRERDHVGRPRVFRRQPDPPRPAAAGERRHAGPCRRAARSHRGGSAADRRLRDRALHGAVARSGRRRPRRARRQRRPGRAGAAAVLHRHQRSGRTESDRRAIRSAGRSRCSMPGPLAAGRRARHGDARRAIARGQEIFNTKPIVLSGRRRAEQADVLRTA